MYRLVLFLIALGLLLVNWGAVSNPASATDGLDLTWHGGDPLLLANRNMGVAVLNGDIYLVGGGPSHCGFSNRAFKGLAPEVANSMNGNDWQEIEPMAEARDGLGAAAADGKVYAIAGATACGPVLTSAVEEYDPTSPPWASRAPLPDGRHNPVVVAFGGKVYAFGGNFNQLDARRYDPATNAWTPLTSPPEPVGAGGQPRAVVVDSKIYVIRGGNEEVLEYDPSTDGWAPKASIPSQRDGFGLAVVNGKIYVVGGHDITKPDTPERYLVDILVYDPATDTWSSITPSGSPWFTGRSGLAVTAVGNEIFAIGGLTFTANFNAPREIFDLVEVARVGGLPVGGIVELAAAASDLAAGGSGSSGRDYAAPVAAAVAAGAIAIAAGAWYTRRRWLG